MFVLICNNQIAGETDSPDNLPAGYQALEVPRQPLENLYFDGAEVQMKPPKPSDRAVWDGAQWIEVEVVAPYQPPVNDALIKAIDAVRKAKTNKELSSLVADALTLMAGVTDA
jgi:hypothetical protein